MQSHKLARVISGPDGKIMLTVDGRSLFQLNPLAASIWAKLLEGRSAEQIISELVTQFDAPEERVTRDVMSFLEILRQNYLIKESPRKAPPRAVLLRLVRGMTTTGDGRVPELPASLDSPTVAKPAGTATHLPEQSTAIKPEVRTFDLFDTLIARRCIHPLKIIEQLEIRLNQPGFAARRIQAEQELAGTQYTLEDIYRRLDMLDEMKIELQLEKENIVPIIETLSKVEANDVIVSDMYLPGDFLRSIVHELTGLIVNPLVVTTNGKASGKVWGRLKETVEIAEHVGDSLHSDVRMAQRYGIPATLTTVAVLSPEEKALYDGGFIGLAETMREARLTTFVKDVPTRNLQLLQMQLNFPILFLAALVLDRTLTEKKICNVLMSSRDCFLWHHLQEKIRTLSGGAYNVVYFLTSRLARRFPSPTYLQYLNQFLNEPCCIVDVSGTGTSLKRLVSQSANPKTPGFMIARHYDDTRSHPSERKDIEEFQLKTVIPRKSHPSLERVNFARHPMVKDVVNVMGTYLPVFFNPAEVDWKEVTHIRIQHEAFFHAMESMEGHDFSNDLMVDDKGIVECLGWLYERMILFEDWGNHWCSEFETKEELSTLALEEQLARDSTIQSLSRK